MGQSRVGDGALVLRKRQPAFPPGEMVSQPTQPRKVFLNHRLVETTHSGTTGIYI